MSDWDYIFSGKSSQRHSVRSSVPKGIWGGGVNATNRPTGIDAWQDYNPDLLDYNPVDPNRPHVIFEPKKKQ